MKKTILIFSCTVFFCSLFIIESLNAQYTTGVTITGIGNTELMKKMEREASGLLTAFNDAFTLNTTPAINFVKDKQSVLTIWEMYPFRCTEVEIFERAFPTYDGGYQLRNIPIFLKDVPDEDATREIAINFDKDGNIFDIYFTNRVIECFPPKVDVTDLRRRQLLIDFTENYLTAYYRKDISLIGKVLIDDVIVTGREIKNIKSPETSRTLPDATRDYLERLKSIFAMNERIDFKLNETMLQQHTKYNHIYGVTFVQILHVKQYEDSSYVFLYIDFINEIEPLIKVRIWKPYEYGKEKYDLNDFM